MNVDRQDDPALVYALTPVRERSLADRRLVCAELTFVSRVILAVRRRS
jgi:hypothetical protein